MPCGARRAAFRWFDTARKRLDNAGLYHYAANNPIRYTDPDGRIVFNATAALVGAAIGAALGAATTALAGGSGRDIAAAALGGAVSGALGGFTFGGSLIAQAGGAVAIGAVSSAAGDVVTNAVAGNEITASGVAKSAAGGAVGGLVGFGVGRAYSRLANNIKRVNGKDVMQNNSIIDPQKIDKNGLTNLERMKIGRAPLGPDDASINLHHENQKMNGLIQEVTESYHKSNYKSLHKNIGQSPSKINRSEFDTWRRNYWKMRALDFE